MSKVGLQWVGNPSKFDEVARLHAIYIDLEHSAGWQDLVARLKMLRTSLVSDLVIGTLDKFGNSRDDAKRAALFVIDKVLAIVPSTHKQYEDLLKRKEEMERRVSTDQESLYGDEIFRNRAPEV